MRRKLRFYAVIVGTGICGGSAITNAGNFTAPLQNNLLLSADINGGPLSSAATPTNGWNENLSAGGFSADNFGVLWTPWGGNNYSGGDNVQLPSSQSSPNVNASSITKSFTIQGSSYYGVTSPISPNPINATISIDTTNNSSKYGTVNGVASLNSRDRGSPSGANGLNDNDMFRDFIFAGGSGSNVQGENFLQLQLSGLNPGSMYQLAVYSYDSSGGHTMNWTATAPTTSNGLDGWWASSPAGNNTFTAPADEQSITWTSATPAEIEYTMTADMNGDLTLWGWGGSGISGQQSADTSYLNGFQLAAVGVPEPATIGMLGLASLGLFIRRRRSA